MLKSIKTAFDNIQEEASNLSGQMSLIEDQLEDDGSEVARLGEGDFAIVTPNETYQK